MHNIKVHIVFDGESKKVMNTKIASKISIALSFPLKKGFIFLGIERKGYANIHFSPPTDLSSDPVCAE